MKLIKSLFFIKTKLIKNLTNLLEVWRDITRLMSQAYVKDGEDYNKIIDEFKLKIKQFETAAEQTILLPQCGRDADGAQENFYIHTLLKYLVPIMKTTFDKYNMGLGIYSMQGVECRNKESKNCAKRFGNYRRNLCKSTMN